MFFILICIDVYNIYNIYEKSSEMRIFLIFFVLCLIFFMNILYKKINR